MYARRLEAAGGVGSVGGNLGSFLGGSDDREGTAGDDGDGNDDGGFGAAFGGGAGGGGGETGGRGAGDEMYVLVYPTNNALLIKFRRSSGAEIFVN